MLYCPEVCRLDHLKLFKDRFRSDPDREQRPSDGLRMASTAQAAHRADMLACYATTQRSLNMQRFLFAVAISCNRYAGVRPPLACLSALASQVFMAALTSATFRRRPSSTPSRS